MSGQFVSTRDSSGKGFDFSHALQEGLALDGGLFVPKVFPDCSKEIAALKGKSYAQVLAWAFKRLAPNFASDKEFQDMADRACEANPEPGLAKLAEDFYALNLCHGRSLSFKDYPLQMLARLLEHARGKLDRKRPLILGATSGDTGSAALAAVAGSGIPAFILYPKGRVSDFQRRQMTTIKADNVFAVAVDGDFDSCQALVKQAFNDPQMRANNSLVAVNSINVARLMTQMAYFIFASLALGAPDRRVRFSVPTGNFGNVLSCHWARRLGLKLEPPAIATNINDRLVELYQEGRISRKAAKATITPAMDISVPSNFERYLFESLGGDAARLVKINDEIAAQGKAMLPADAVAKYRKDFQAFSVSQEASRETMAKIWQDYALLIDPHSAVSFNVALSSREAARKTAGEEDIITVALQVAHPAKFSDTVDEVIGDQALEEKKPPVGRWTSETAVAGVVEAAEENLYSIAADFDAFGRFIKMHSK